MKILIASHLDPSVVEVLSRRHDVLSGTGATPAELRQLVRDRETLIFRSGVDVRASLMECGPELRLLVRAGSGVDNIDLGYVKKRGLELVRIPEPGAIAVAEMSFALMLALSRHLLNADHSLRSGQWAKHRFTGHLLSGKVLGIVGVGNIGSVVAKLGVAWGMRVIGCVEHPSPIRARELMKKHVRLTDLDTLLSTADYISIHVPLKGSTRHLISTARLARMKAGAYLVNLARGGVVDERAVYAALTSEGPLRAAALDVHEHEADGTLSPLASLENVILTPHIGAMTQDSQREIGRRIVEIIENHVDNNIFSSCSSTIPSAT